MTIKSSRLCARAPPNAQGATPHSTTTMAPSVPALGAGFDEFLAEEALQVLENTADADCLALRYGGEVSLPQSNVALFRDEKVFAVGNNDAIEPETSASTGAATMRGTMCRARDAGAHARAAARNAKTTSVVFVIVEGGGAGQVTRKVHS